MIISLVGLLITISGGFIRFQSESSALRHLERLVEVTEKLKNDKKAGSVTDDVRRVQSLYAKRLEHLFNSQAKARNVVTAIIVLLVACLGVGASGYATLEASSGLVDFDSFGTWACVALVVLNLGGVVIAVWKLWSTARKSASVQ
ncbi:hypothetical protein [Curtobacterium sp. MCPF17_021]|uniref:hypothetical protein n=1 Tax=Curtobacterium sp. MCPF17_021 TaxID=2175639 RepID=UPI0011B6FF73|nr:hypothetical protein [Curtobacterium sp. MCPF17_021]WIE81734.1 hypothetical protein DEJ29_009905 [Curtobacterium sp. MCPF17_021]